MKVTDRSKIFALCVLGVCCCGQTCGISSAPPALPTAQEFLQGAPEGLPELPNLTWGEFRLEATDLEPPTCQECLDTQDAWDEWNSAVDPVAVLTRFGEDFAYDPIDALANVAFVATYYWSGGPGITEAGNVVNDIFLAMGGCGLYCDEGDVGGPIIPPPPPPPPPSSLETVTVRVVCHGVACGPQVCTERWGGPYAYYEIVFYEDGPCIPFCALGGVTNTYYPVGAVFSVQLRRTSQLVIQLEHNRPVSTEYHDYIWKEIEWPLDVPPTIMVDVCNLNLEDWETVRVYH